MRKHYDGADIVCYMPFDTRRNARRFVRMVRPEKAFFIKYEFWKNFLDELHRSGAEVYSVSSIFRRGQAFFRPWGRPYANVLKDFTRLFVQNGESKRLLSTIGVERSASRATHALTASSTSGAPRAMCRRPPRLPRVRSMCS